MSTLHLGKWGEIVVKSCGSEEECKVRIDSAWDSDYINRDDAIKLIEFLQIEYRLGQYGEDDYVEPECEHEFVPFGDAPKHRCQKCYLINQGPTDELRQQARADSLRANGITEEELAESAHAHREAAELGRGQ